MTDLNAKLTLSLVDKLSKPLKGLGNNFNNFTSSAKKFGVALGGVAQGAKSTALRLGVLGAAGTWFFKKQLIDTASEFEVLDTRMKALTGSSEAAQKASKWIEDFATKTPGSIQGLTDAFALLKNFGIDPMDGSFQSLVDQTSKVGYTQEKLMGISLALGQSWAAMKLQGQDINQLINQGVPVWDLLSKALKKPVPILKEMSSAGKIGRKEISLMLAQMGTDSKGASAEMMKTWSGMVSNIEDQFTRFKNAIMRAGVFDWIKIKLGGLLSQIDTMAANGQLEKWAKNIGEEIKRLLKGMFEFGESLFNKLKKIYNFLEPVIDKLGAANIVIGALAAFTFAPLIASLVQLIPAVTSLGVALAANPIGALILGMTLAAIAFKKIYDNWDNISKYFSKTWERFKNSGTTAKVVILALLAPFTVLLGPIAAIAAGAALIVSNWEPLKDFFTDLWGWIKEKATDLIKFLTDNFKPLIKTLDILTKPGRTAFNFIKENAKEAAWVFGAGQGNENQQRAAQLMDRSNKQDVGGTLKIKIDGPGKVTEMSSNGPMDYQTDTGWSMVD